MEEEKVCAVQKMQDYIHENIMAPITLSALARYCGYSPFHSIRVFKELMGRTPFEYIRMIRLAKAALRLRDGNVRVLDTALDFMFDSHEGFTRAFSKEFGITPSHYRRRPSPIRLFMPSSVLSYYNYLQRGETTMEKEHDAVT
ncbi:MAG TPA: AraC family transcriptional regulator, partial [Bacillota bacterium]|nr:AraC family transcriptional regulator [Bacillota bacterium]